MQAALGACSVPGCPHRASVNIFWCLPSLRWDQGRVKQVALVLTDLMGLWLFLWCQVKNALAPCSVSLFPERDEPRIKEQSTNPLFYERGTQGRRVGLRKKDVKLPRSSSN